MFTHSRRLFAHTVIAALMLSLAGAASAQVAGNSTQPTAGSISLSDTEQIKEKTQQQQQAFNQQHQKQNEEAAKAINETPGVHVTPQQLAVPEEDTIQGFHPVKRLLAPIVRLEKNTVQLQQQIMKLEGPIAGLQRPMLGLHKKMDSVEQCMQGMSTQLNTMDTNVIGVNKSMGQVHEELIKVDSRVAAIEQPILGIQKPLNEVAGPLTEVRQELMRVEVLIGAVLFTIIVAAVAIAVGTPIAAVLIYRNRHKLFPGVSDHEFPVAKASGTQGQRLA